jgi:hypothetical protein
MQNTGWRPADGREHAERGRVGAGHHRAATVAPHRGRDNIRKTKANLSAARCSIHQQALPARGTSTRA